MPRLADPPAGPRSDETAAASGASLVDLVLLGQTLRALSGVLTSGHVRDGGDLSLLDAALSGVSPELHWLHRCDVRGGGLWEMRDSRGRCVGKLTPPVDDDGSWTYAVWNPLTCEME